MIRQRLAGVLFLILGLLVAIGPHTIFPVCEAMGDGYMKCHWTAQAVLGIGVSIAVLGVLLIMIASKPIRIGISLALIPYAVLVILIPNLLIGVCGKLHMRCHSLTLPALNVLGIVLLLAAGINVWLLWSSNRKEESE
jgi:hypothetical protein